LDIWRENDRELFQNCWFVYIVRVVLSHTGRSIGCGGHKFAEIYENYRHCYLFFAHDGSWQLTIFLLFKASLIRGG
jgi:hypothetical protein